MHGTKKEMVYTVFYDGKTKEFQTEIEAKKYFNHRLAMLTFGYLDLKLKKKFYDNRINRKKNFEINVYTVNKFGNMFPAIQYSQFEIE